MSEDKGIDSTSVENLADTPGEGKNKKKSKISFGWMKKRWGWLLALSIVCIFTVIISIVITNNEDTSVPSQGESSEITPEDEKALNMMPQTLEDKVLALVASGDSAGADKMINDEIEKESDAKKKASLYITKSMSLAAQERYEEAIEVANLAVETDGSIGPMIVLYLADMYSAIGDVESGVRLIDEEVAKLSGKDDPESKQRLTELNTKKRVIQNEG